MQREQEPLRSGPAHLFNLASHRHDDPMVRLTGQALQHTGLRSNTYGHLCKEWILFRGDEIKLDIPDTMNRCPKPTDNCGECNARGHEDGFQTKDANGGRVIKVPESWTNPHTGEEEELGLRDLLTWHFTENDCIDLASNAVTHHVHRLAKMADEEIAAELTDFEEGCLSRRRGTVENDRRKWRVAPDIMPHDLRGSFGVHLARQTDNQFKIRDLMGHEDVATTNKYIKFLGKHTDDAIDSY